MHILWKYLQPLRWWIALSLLLAAAAQLLTRIDPRLCGITIDGQALNPDARSATEPVRGAPAWLLPAAAGPLAARIARTFPD